MRLAWVIGVGVIAVASCESEESPKLNGRGCPVDESAAEGMPCESQISCQDGACDTGYLSCDGREWVYINDDTCRANGCYTCANGIRRTPCSEVTHKCEYGCADDRIHCAEDGAGAAPALGPDGCPLDWDIAEGKACSGSAYCDPGEADCSCGEEYGVLMCLEVWVIGDGECGCGSGGAGAGGAAGAP
jgi:hypothetical protein